jgi:NAD-dependent SIR2 family protein deacetylase
LIKGSDILNTEVSDKDPGTAGYGHTEGVMEIHGNWKYMRCSNEEDCPSDNHFHNIPSLPHVGELESDSFNVPTCPHCQAIMK